MVHRVAQSQLYIRVEGFLDEVQDDDYEKLTAIADYLKDLKKRVNFEIEVKELQTQVRDVGSEYLSIFEAFEDYEWVLASDIAAKSKLNRGIVLGHMTRFTNRLYPRIFEHTPRIPNPTRLRHGQGWRVREGQLDTLKKLIQEGRNPETA